MIIQSQIDNTPLPGRGHKVPSMDIGSGAQNGFMPRLGGVSNGKVYSEYVSAAPHIRNRIIAIPLSTPGFFSMVAQGADLRKLKKWWCDIMSVHCKSITGLQGKISLETAEVQLGPSGSLFLESGTKVTMERSQIVNAYDERLNKPFTDFFDWLVTSVEGHQHTQTPIIASIPEVRALMKDRPWSPDLKTGTILYVELDLMNVNVIDAWLAGNIAPKNGGDHEGGMDITASREAVTFDVPVTCLVETGDYINQYAQHVVDRMAVFTRNPTTDMKIFVNRDEANDTLTNPEGAGYNEDAGLTSPIEQG